MTPCPNTCVLHDAGLVTVRADGKRRLHRDRREGLTAMWRFVDEMWSDPLVRPKHAERAERPERRG